MPIELADKYSQPPYWDQLGPIRTLGSRGWCGWHSAAVAGKSFLSDWVRCSGRLTSLDCLSFAAFQIPARLPIGRWRSDLSWNNCEGPR